MLRKWEYDVVVVASSEKSAGKGLGRDENCERGKRELYSKVGLLRIPAREA